MSTATGPLTTKHRDGQILPFAMASAVQAYKGAAAAVVIGTGYALPLVPTTITHQFVGVWGETILSVSPAGTTFTQILRRGCFSFSQSGTTIVAAHIGLPAYFADDNTVTLAAGTTYAGVICAVDAAGNVWVDIEQAVRQASNSGKNWILLAGSTDAVSPHINGNYMVTTAGVDAMTLAAPTASIDDGVELVISSSTANAHTLTATGLLNTGTASVNLATFAARAGAGLTLRAYNAKWNVIASVGITFS